MRPPPRRPAAGFTLIELLVVMVIIGILLSFILVAGIQGVRNAQSAATRALITKLDVAIADRLDALLSQRPDVTPVHLAMAMGPNNAIGSQRARVIAQIDMLRALMPDTFFVQTAPAIGAAPAAGTFPLNFAANPDPVNSSLFLPLGSAGPGTGVNGASYSAQAGFMKGFGYGPLGSNGADDNNDGFVDDLLEGSLVQATAGGAYAADQTLADKIATNLSLHTHKTARSEALYAVLVEGSGPLGSYFSKDDFTAREVQDTDGDGLPEFVDAWGEPLQFYRWPFYYNSDTQRGFLPYSATSLADVRDQNPMDPNQQLMAPAWFLAGGTPGTNAQPASGTNPANFQTLFFSLVDPNTTGGTAGTLWDRSGNFGRRAYAWKPLILSSGPDKQLGVAMLGVDYSQLTTITDGSGGPVAFNNATNLLLIENQAARGMDPVRAGTFLEHWAVTPQPSQTSAFLTDAGQDDISNQNLSSPGAP